jgi:hypothetical protein
VNRSRVKGFSIDPEEVACCAAKFPMPHQSRGPSVFDHFAAMIFAQLTNRGGFLVFPTNTFTLDAILVAAIYRKRVVDPTGSAS